MKTAACVMTTIASDSLSSAAANGRDGRPGALAEITTFWRHFLAKAFNPYRPELYYMRGPGPAWRAKHNALSPAVQSMVVEIRASKTIGSPARS
jgi:hypothetical protein